MHTVQDEHNSGRAIIKLVKYLDGDYAVFSSEPHSNVRGTLKDATKALSKLGVQFDSIEAAYVDMELRGNNVAQFGVLNKTFMFSRYEAAYAPTYGVA